MRKYNIYYSRLNSDTKNYGGLEWIIDGERGRRSYPGTMPECLVCRLYESGLNKVPCIGFCDNCIGATCGKYCKKDK